MHNPPHPGLVLREYLGDLPVSNLRITGVTLSRVLNGKAGISAAMAIRLAAALGTTPELWSRSTTSGGRGKDGSRLCNGLRTLPEDNSWFCFSKDSVAVRPTSRKGSEKWGTQDRYEK